MLFTAHAKALKNDLASIGHTFGLPDTASSDEILSAARASAGNAAALSSKLSAAYPESDFVSKADHQSALRTKDALISDLSAKLETATTEIATQVDSMVVERLAAAGAEPIRRAAGTGDEIGSGGLGWGRTATTWGRDFSSHEKD